MFQVRDTLPKGRARAREVCQFGKHCRVRRLRLPTPRQLAAGPEGPPRRPSSKAIFTGASKASQAAQNRILGLPLSTPSAEGDAGHRLCPRHFAYSRPCRAQLGEVRVYRAAREGPESVTKLPRPTVPDRSLEPVSSTRRQPSSREIERPKSTYCGRSRPRPWTPQLAKGFGRRPLGGRSGGLWGRRTKASQGGNRGEVGAGWAGAPYGDFGVTDQALVALRELVTRIVHGEGFRMPAPWGTVVRVVGPAYESLPRMKPRGGWGLVGRARPMGILASRTKRWWHFGSW